MKLSEVIIAKIQKRIKDVESMMWRTGVPADERVGIVASKLELERVITYVQDAAKRASEEDEEEIGNVPEEQDEAEQKPRRRTSRPRSWSPGR